MEVEVNGVRYFKGKSLADLPPGLSPKTYDSGRGSGREEVETNIKTIRIPLDVANIFMAKARELIDALKDSPQVEDAIVMEYHLTCTLEPKAVFEKRILAEEEKGKNQPHVPAIPTRKNRGWLAHRLRKEREHSTGGKTS